MIQMDKRQVRLLKMQLECESFYNATQLLWEDYQNAKDDIGKALPWLVNSVFTCELALKAILIYCNVVYGRSHLLYTLISKVPCDFMEKVLEWLQKYRYPNRDRKRLTNDIKSVSDAFRQFRYIADYSPTVEINFVRDLTEILFVAEQAFCDKVSITCNELEDEQKQQALYRSIDSAYQAQIQETEQADLKMQKSKTRKTNE